MNRRAFLRTTGAGGLGGLVGFAGCTGEDDQATPTQTPTSTPAGDEAWGGVYFQPHVAETALVGRSEAEWYGVAAAYTHPHQFWVVTGGDVSLVDVDGDDDAHFMVVLWDAETGHVPATASLSLEFYRDGEFLLERDAWPMLSQSMGFHFGDNVPLEGAGSYEVELSVDPLGTRRTGAFADRFDELASTRLSFEFDPGAVDETRDTTPERAGQRDAAMEPMEMEGVPAGQLPPAEELPGEYVGEGTSHHAVLAVTALRDEPRFDAGGATYLAVSARTPYNRYPLSNLSLSATLERDGEAVFEGPLTETFDPELALHHGAVVDGLAPGDELTVGVDSRPLVSRHAGYERAFLEMSDVSMTV